MKRIVFFLSCVLFVSNANAQLSTENWLATQFGVQLKKYVVQADFGYRFQDFRLSHARQTLGRIAFLRKINDMAYGAGFASFQHIRSNSEFVNENRPFVQAEFRKQKTRVSVQSRFRHEFRFFENEALRQRSRIKLDFRIGKGHLQLFTAQELFVTHAKGHLFETRTQLGFAVNLPGEQQILTFYQLNYNSLNQQHLIHVLGLNYNKRITIQDDQH
ncbi:MAG: DUF2490 domain-containing protein [Fluviicola sp.]|jgi:hypothetical protein